MARLSLSPLAVFAAYSLGIEATVGYVLGGSTGLSEFHKTVLVGFLVGFPILSLLIFPLIATRETRRLADEELADLSESLAFRRPPDLRAAE